MRNLSLFASALGARCSRFGADNITQVAGSTVRQALMAASFLAAGGLSLATWWLSMRAAVGEVAAGGSGATRRRVPVEFLRTCTGR